MLYFSRTQQEGHKKKPSLSAKSLLVFLVLYCFFSPFPFGDPLLSSFIETAALDIHFAVSFAGVLNAGVLNTP